jgi:hypothetical protein
MTIAGLGLVAAAFITKDKDVQTFHAPRLIAAFGWSYLVLGSLLTAVVATGASWFHQVLIRRVTFALFRLYATVVSAGIGSVFGWALGWWMLLKEIPHTFPWWALGMFTLIAGFGFAAYSNAHQLRGEPPKDFTWILPKSSPGLTVSCRIPAPTPAAIIAP